MKTLRFLAQDMACFRKCSLCALKQCAFYFCCVGIYFFKYKLDLVSWECCFGHSCPSWIFCWLLLSITARMRCLNCWGQLCVCHCSWWFNLCIFKDFLSMPLLEDCCVSGIQESLSLGTLSFTAAIFPAVLAVLCNIGDTPGSFCVFFPIYLPFNLWFFSCKLSCG